MYFKHLVTPGDPLGEIARMILAAALIYALTIPVAKVPPSLSTPVTAAGWPGAAHAKLEQDLTYRAGDQGQTTDAYIETDNQYIYIGFVCKQNVPVVAEQHTNSAGIGSDDSVTVKLWPGGKNSIVYTYSATPNGTHDQLSTENTAFSPPWDSVGKRTEDGYTVAMRIPRNIMHGDGRLDWPVQLGRYVAKKSLRLVWAYESSMTYMGDPLYAGTATAIGIKGGGVAQALARFQPYVLAQSNAPHVGASASRAGFDFSIPLAGESAFYGTVHPDYSEVERDQQTIAPSEFQNRYKEVRPFFTQGANYYASDSLYTPAIPTPRYGYAIEGNRHGFTYAGFDAVGKNGRDDNAQTLSVPAAASFLERSALPSTGLVLPIR